MSETAEQRQLTDLRGQVALITGASSGIGEAIAEALAARGAHLALTARREDRLRALAERLAGTVGGGETLVIACDVRQPEQVEGAVRQTMERWG
ncbi:MAG TPA: SDR family NAD(P)-dependent oxidoreductase, partial [Ktedonobacterales bacterium]